MIGGIGSGKSYLARKLREKHPVEIVEGDAAGHLVLKEPNVKEQLRKVFGDGILNSAGEVIRSQLSKLVFGPGPEQKSARQKLEEVVHPRITEILSRQVAWARSRPDIEAVIIDAAILLEAGWRELCDCVVYVETPFELRLARVATRGWSREELQLREASQFPLEQKRKEADYVVDNSGDGEVALSQLEEVYSQVLSGTFPRQGPS